MTDSRPLVLIVDDQPVNLKVLATALDPEFKVQMATNGPEALRLARRSHYPRVILLDVMMPDMDGYAVCTALKADPLTADIPVLFITAKTDVESESAGLEVGAVDFIHKPINPELVRARVRIQHELAQHRRHLEELVHARTLELAQARDAADGANRAKTAFLRNVSHEMRTPIHQISGLGHLLRLGLSEPRDQQRLDTLQQATQNLLRLVTDLLDFSGLEAGELLLESRPFDARALLTASIEERAPDALGKGLRLATSVDPDLPATLLGDPGRLGQILGHVLDNAIKFSARGEIQVQMRAGERHGRRLHLHLEVTDQGIGIDQEMLERLFARFEAGDASMTREQGGLGLGLALCQRLVRLMLGEIDLTSTPGRGTTVTLWVPLEIPGPTNGEV